MTGNEVRLAAIARTEARRSTVGPRMVVLAMRDAFDRSVAQILREVFFDAALGAGSKTLFFIALGMG